MKTEAEIEAVSLRLAAARKRATDLAFGVSIAFYVREDGTVAQVLPGERFEPPQMQTLLGNGPTAASGEVK